MIEDLEWRFDGKESKWILFAYDGHVWFPVPFNYEKGIDHGKPV